MKRFALLLTVTLLAAIFISSPLLASPPRTENGFSYFQAFISRCLAQFVCPFHGYIELPPVDGDEHDGALGGDADDYANGRGEPGDGDEKRNGRLNAGPAVIGPEDIKPIYRIHYGN